MDSRYSSSSGTYDQSHAYPINQRTAVGHAVRAMYLYSGMTDVAMILNNSSYATAVNAIWDNFVNRKLYVTGGVGSGETSEGSAMITPCPMLPPTANPAPVAAVCSSSIR
jgi:hypothetical protein